MITAVFGLPGSGKTFFARQLALSIDGLLISSDTVRNDMARGGRYDENTKIEVYQMMLVMMGDAVRDKRNVVIDATFYKENIRSLFKEKATELHGPLYFIEIKAPEEIIKERVSKKRIGSEADFGVYLKIKEEFEPLKEDHLVLYSDHEALSEMLDTTLAYINFKNEKR